jgi:hypothetical protein
MAVSDKERLRECEFDVGRLKVQVQIMQKQWQRSSTGLGGQASVSAPSSGPFSGPQFGGASPRLRWRRSAPSRSREPRQAYSTPG